MRLSSFSLPLVFHAFPAHELHQLNAYLRRDFEKALDGRWLVFRHDDRPPNRYHALADWRRGESEWTSTIQDSFGGLRLFHAKGWEGPRLVWQGNAIAASAGALQRFVFERTDPALFHLSYETQQPDGDWRLVDSSACARTAG